MAYAQSAAVAALCSGLLGASSNFSPSSSPTLVSVENWLSTGCAVLESYLGGHHYSTPVASTAGAYNWMSNLNALYAAAMAEMSRSSAIVSPGERTRNSVLLDQFWSELKTMVSLDLTALGVTRGSAGKLYVGGISQSDKEIYEDDSDRVSPRFTRDMHDFPGTLKSTSSGS